MRYIYNRNKFSKYNKVNEILDSDNLDVDFSDTLIGGTLNKFFGLIRSNMSADNMVTHIKNLDKILATVVVRPSLKEINKDKSEEKNISLEELSEEGKELQSSIIYLSAVKQQVDGNEEEAQKLLEQIPKEILKGLPEAEKTSAIILHKEEDSISEFKEGEMALYKEVPVKVVSIEDDNIVSVKNEEGKEISVNKNELTKDEVSDEVIDNSKEFDMIKKKEEELNKMKEYCERCLTDKNISMKVEKLINVAESQIDALKNRLNRKLGFDDGTYKELENNIKMLHKICDTCETGGENITENINNLLNNYFLILEKNETATIGVLTNSDLKKIKKKLDLKNKDLKITEEDLKKLNKSLTEKKGIGEITGADAKKIMGILNKAKNSLITSKPYDEISKKQKRYFDKLDGGRAISRKAYQKWVKDVTELVNYYKDELPKEVITLISDSLDKEAISNDYVKISKEFLGVDTRSDKGVDKKDGVSNKEANNEKEGTIKGTNENKLRFVGVNKLEIKRQICFVMEVVSDNGGSGFITCIIFKVSGNKFQFKYIRGINIHWLQGYFSDKTIDTKADKPETNNKNINDDLKGVDIVKTNKYGDVFYGQATIKSKEVKKGEHISIEQLNFSKLIKNNLTEVADVKLIDEKTMNTPQDVIEKPSKWQVDKIGVLVGYKDLQLATYKINSKNFTEKDGFFEPKLYNQITELFLGDTAKTDVNNLHVGDNIKYRKNDGEINDGTIGAREDIKEDTVRIVTPNSPGGFIINKNQIVQ